MGVLHLWVPFIKKLHYYLFFYKEICIIVPIYKGIALLSIYKEICIIVPIYKEIALLSIYKVHLHYCPYL